MSAPAYYVLGGTLAPDAPSYVEHRADTDLYNALRAGDFCYVRAVGGKERSAPWTEICGLPPSVVS